MPDVRGGGRAIMAEAVTVDVITFTAQVAKIQTMIDGGIRVTLDLPGSAIGTVMALMQCREPGVLLEIAAVPVRDKDDVRGSARKIHI